ncbi:hypothetical protein [Sinomonas atrocyanea]|uniref:hypothetical protein n=1 Tax=Sinomonas atrocyanea TaxID=37927 RepID=UPI002784EAA1|nr:hypothetical protein [Sinomonas atrocyanea]MDQ0259546.1 hypothetical protein [Sinomonas atrocyanea]MDR6623195.1 hypothetical protein [Sinomonas atrocyanea]
MHVALNLSNEVSVRDLRTFLNCIPQYFDANQDLRYFTGEEDRASFLAVVFPSLESRHAADAETHGAAA